MSSISARRRRRSNNHVCKVAAEVSLLESRCLMSRSALSVPAHGAHKKHFLASPSDVLTPTNSVGKLSQVFFDGLPATALKTITITNVSTTETVYPIIEDKNNAAPYKDPSKSFVGSIYDPEDPLNDDYRGYIGYTPNGGVNTLGLLPGASITIKVPLVFWDAARIDITTDPTFITTNLKEGDPITNNPFQYYEFAADGKTPTARYWDPAISSSGGNGMVYWYHAPIARAPLDDAPSQLAEFTIRDPYQLKLNPTLDPKTLGPLINYDVSYVDSMVLPVAMAALDVPVPVPGATNPPRKPYGWIGAAQNTDTLQKAIQNFTNADPKVNGLGNYFGGNGWPKFIIPTTTRIKVPSGTNTFADSPLFDVRSSYDTFGAINQFQLTSGGTGAILVPGGNGGFSDGTKTLKLVQAPKLNFLSDGMVVALAGGQPNGPKVPQGTAIAPNGIIKKDGQVVAVQLTNAIPDSKGRSFVFTFQRPLMDYASDRITRLWYSWANYFVLTHPIAGVNNRAGQIAKGSRVLKTNVAGLEVGMGVNGKAILDGTTISSIDTKSSTVKLSQLAKAAGTSFNFTAPSLASIAGSKYYANSLIPLNFAAGKETDDAKQFSQAVYNIMSAMSTIPPDTSKPASTQPIQLMVNVIGCNVGFLNGKDLLHPANNVNKEITNEIRDQTKSVLRGVYDFNQVPQFNPVTGALQWYPDPSLATGGQDFNVKNLDPFVWFVHEQLHLSGYGFSVDDDTADIGANGATQLGISVGGLGAGPNVGLPNKAEWTSGAPFGPLSATGEPERTSSSTQPGDSIKNVTDLTGGTHDTFYSINFTQEANAVQGALVNGPGIQPNTRVANINLSDFQVILDKTLDPNFTPVKGTSYPYTFFGGVTGTGTLQPATNQISGLDPDVVAVLAKVGAGPSVVVTGSGIPPGTTLDSVDTTNNLVVLKPPSALTPPTGTGPFYYTFA